MAHVSRPSHGPQVPGKAALTQAMRAFYEDPDLQPRLERFRRVQDPLDLCEELALARALLEQFLASYEEQNRWARTWQEAQMQQREGPPPPVRWLTPDEAVKFLKIIGDLARGIQAMRMQDVMSKAEVQFKIFQLARVVEDAVQQAEVQEGWREGLLATIKERWLEVWI